MAHEVYGSVIATIAIITIVKPSLELGWLAFINNNGGRVVVVIITC
jgi:hypothetical protein